MEHTEGIDRQRRTRPQRGAPRSTRALQSFDFPPGDYAPGHRGGVSSATQGRLLGIGYQGPHHATVSAFEGKRAKVKDYIEIGRES